MKKIIGLWMLILLVLFSCSKPEKIAGFAGKPIYLAPTIKAAEDTLGCTYSWSFTDKPEGSNMDILSFQPSSRSYNISFVPDVVGQYVVSYSITGSDGKTRSSKDLICEVAEDTTSTAAVETEEYPLTPAALKAPAPVYTNTKTKPLTTPVYTPPSTKPVYQAPSGKRGKSIPKIPGKYTIQISSWKSYASAEKAVSKIANLGLDLYIQKVYFKETGETWYRVRTGNFDQYAAAKQTMVELQSKIPAERLWIDNVREDQ
jgi:cell division septation protein DedD